MFSPGCSTGYVDIVLGENCATRDVDVRCPTPLHGFKIHRYRTRKCFRKYNSIAKGECEGSRLRSSLLRSRVYVIKIGRCWVVIWRSQHAGSFCNCSIYYPNGFGYAMWRSEHAGRFAIREIVILTEDHRHLFIFRGIWKVDLGYTCIYVVELF